VLIVYRYEDDRIVKKALTASARNSTGKGKSNSWQKHMNSLADNRLITTSLMDSKKELRQEVDELIRNDYPHYKKNIRNQEESFQMFGS